MAILPIAVVLATLSLGLSASEVQPAGREHSTRPFSSVLTVNNGQEFGEWTWREMCPGGTHAAGFSLRVDPKHQSGDDTSLNGIRLFCLWDDIMFKIESHPGYWGDWSMMDQWCPLGERLISFQLRVQTFQYFRDDTAANNIKFRCSGNQVLEGDGNDLGEYGDWSEQCHDGAICGIETNMEEPQGSGDDTALNDVRFFCCSYSQK